MIFFNSPNIMSEIELEIVSPKEVLAKETHVTEIVLPGTKGQLDVLPGHTELISTLKQGEVRYKTTSSSKSYNITGGLFAINNNKASILIDSLIATVTNLDDVRRGKEDRRK